MKRLARETMQESGQVVAQAMQGLPEGAAVQMTGMHNQKRTVQRVRQQANPIPRQPNSIAELDIPPHLTILPNGEQFLLHDSGQDAGNNR